MNPITFSSFPRILESSAVVGGLEHQGPLGSSFDLFDHDTKFGMDTWEKAESRMVHLAASLTIQKAKLSPEDVDLVFAGDLMNQCTSSSFAFRNSGLSYCGLYGACSTFVLSLGLAGMSVEGGFAGNVLCSASSHFCTAERQYRFPLEYGNQRTPTSQTTVTGCGCVIVSSETDAPVGIAEFLPGRILDLQITDTNNMGAAMAPAALDTLLRYRSFTGNDLSAFDLIATGDLGAEGKKMLRVLATQKGLELGENLDDCGTMIYDLARQDVHAGGSGCGCSASVFSGYLMKKLKSGELHDVLLIGTGALMSPTTALQNETIPGIAHLVRIRRFH